MMTQSSTQSGGGPNRKSCCSWFNAKSFGTIIAVVGSLLIMAWMSSLLIARSSTPAVDHKRAEQRRLDAIEVQSTSKDLLNNYAWQDQGKEIVRIPVQRSMELMVQEWKDPKEGRAKLLDQVKKANEVPTYE
jgi:hypothetical protein